MTTNVPSSPASPDRTALVIGATGGFGGAVARALTARGWRVRALHRRPDQARQQTDLPASIEWVAGNAMLRNDVASAAAGADVIVHGANPPGYRNWRELAVPMLANTIDAARSTGARILFPGNVYNFGPDAWPVVTEESPQHPVSRKGAIRVEMEAMLADAAARGVRSLVVRAGDYYGPHAPSSWLHNVMIKPNRPVRAVTWPGAPGVGHAFAYLPDLGEAAARLLGLGDRLDDFEVVNFGGHWVDPGEGFAEALVRAAGRPDAPIRRLPWAVMWLLAPFVSTVREVLEMRYLWRTPLRLDNARLVSLIGDEPHTPLDTALRQTLAGMGCLGDGPVRIGGGVSETPA
jgi:nucleoside-diphosphate-sugar epimerase